MKHYIITVTVILAGCAPTMTSPPPPTPAPTTTPPPAVAVAEPEPLFEWEPDFRRLTRADFEAFMPADDTWSETEGVLTCTGKPRGYLFTKESFSNFTLRLEYRFLRPEKLGDEMKFKGNTGFLIYITGEQKLWPLSLEVQGKHVQIGAIKENGGAEPPKVQDDDAVRQTARKPVGQWNALEIVSRDGSLTVQLNGQQVATSEPAFLSSGAIGIQAEDFPFEVRRLRIRPTP